MYIYNFKMKEIRKSKGISQKQLASTLNTQQCKISDYERGAMSPTLERLVEIAAALDVSLDELVEMKQIHKQYSDELSKKIKGG